MSKGIKRGHESMEEVAFPKSKFKRNNFFCELCKIELANESSMKQHLLGRKHRSLNDAEEERKRIERKCGIFVKGFPPNLDQEKILNYFSKYGKVIWYLFKHSFALLDYTEPSAVNEIIKKNHYLGGNRLMVKCRQQSTNNRPEQVKMSEQEESNYFIQDLKDVSQFDEQVRILIQNLHPHKDDMIPKYIRIYEDLYNALFPAFPYCQIHPFGSTKTGLNFNNSDVDVFISGIKSNDNDVPYLYKTKNLLLKSQRFSSIIVIRHAKIPILKCVHIETGISCDINLRNMLGVCNSELIVYYLNIDPKVRSLMMVLKFWAKVHNITGKNHLFSNYSLIMMLIFFLQQAPYIPPVLELQQNPQFFYFQDGWNGGFQRLLIESSLKHTSVLKLLEGFFTFYIEFEYGVNIICPYLGKPVKKKDFTTPDKLSDCFDCYKYYVSFGIPLRVDTSICIQDPFEHCRNVTAIVSASILNEFVSFCRLGKKLCDEGESGLLYKLLTEIPQNFKTEFIVKPEFSQFSIQMQAGLKYIEEKYENVSDRQKAWFESVVKFTTIVLKDILKFDITEINSPASENKNKKCEAQLDVYEKKEICKICYKAVTKLNFWQARKSAAKNITELRSQKNGIVEKEIAITNRLCDLYKDTSQSVDIIDIEITLEPILEPPEVIVKIKKLAVYKNSFKSFATFLSANLPSWFKLYENEQNHSVQNTSK